LSVSEAGGQFSGATPRNTEFLALLRVVVFFRGSLVEGVPLEETLALREGVVVTIVPRPIRAAGDEP
jgi:hypothetical protein